MNNHELYESPEFPSGSQYALRRPVPAIRGKAFSVGSVVTVRGVRDVPNEGVRFVVAAEDGRVAEVTRQVMRKDFRPLKQEAAGAR